MTNKINICNALTDAFSAYRIHIKLKIIFYIHLERSHTSTTEVALLIDRKNEQKYRSVA